MYEYGYTMTIGSESREVVLGTCTEAEVEAKRRETDAANAAERRPKRPTIGGAGTPATYWVRPKVA